jgi:acetolactate synthase-1/2/3 large subunit
VGIGINPKLAQRIKESDLVIAIGPRLGEMTTSGYTLLEVPKPKQKLVHIHASAEELNRVYHADLAICATMNAAARSLEVLTAPPSVPWTNWAQQANADYVANTQAQALAGLPTDSANGLVNMPEVVAALQRHLPADAVLTNGAGNFASWIHRYYKHHGLSKGHKTQLAPTVGAMGYGVPAGVAASVLTGRVAFTIAGDGDFLMNGQELATATQHGAKSIVVLLNNGMYGTIRMHQERDFPTHNMGSNLNNPHFANLAKAYGYEGIRISKTEEFEPALIAALASNQGTLIEIMLDPEVITTRGTLSAITQNALKNK